MFAPRKLAWKPNNRVSKKTVLFNTCNSSVSCWFSQSFPQYSNFTAENYILNPALHFSAGKTDKSLLDNMFLHIINHHPSHTIFPPGVNIKPQTHRPWFIRTVLLKYFDIFKNLLQWYTLPIQQPLDAGIPQFFLVKIQGWSSPPLLPPRAKSLLSLPSAPKTATREEVWRAHRAEPLSSGTTSRAWAMCMTLRHS